MQIIPPNISEIFGDLETVDLRGSVEEVGHFPGSSKSKLLI